MTFSADYCRQPYFREGNPYPASGELTVAEVVDSKDNEDDFELYRRLIHRPSTVQESLDRITDRERVLKFNFSWERTELWRPVFFSPDLLDDKVSNVEVASRFIPVQSRPSNESIADEYSQLQLGNKLPKLISALRKIDDRIGELRILSPYGERIVWAETDDGQVPLRLFGEGTNRFCHFLMTMMAVKPPYLFIDEIENGIHHTVQAAIWQEIGDLARDPELNIQVFATTHSYEMIRAAYEAFSEDNKLEDFRYHRLSRSRKTGELRATTYGELDMEAVAAFDFDHEVR